jgi:hypothetical protein
VHCFSVPKLKIITAVPLSRYTTLAPLARLAQKGAAATIHLQPSKKGDAASVVMV